jgi:ssDNA-binding Zn-finger/Zn-ribbon topoisomerase 1
MVKYILISLVMVFLLSACSNDKDKKKTIPDQLADYSGRVACPKCKSYLHRNILEEKTLLVTCPKCKIKAPRHVFCRDRKKQNKK